MSLVAATTVAALLIASPSTTDADRIAANGGFLLGNAHRCGIDTDRVVHAGQLVRDLIAAATGDSKEAAEAASERFARFFIVSAFADPTKEKFVASCAIVGTELARLEQHPTENAAEAVGPSAASEPRPGDGE